MAHRTTWISNQKPTPPRKNVYRNQIDYIIIRKKKISQAQDARSFSGIETFTDHKLVKASFKIKCYKIKFNKPEIKPKIERLLEENIAKAYKEKTNELLHQYTKEDETPQDRWMKMCKSCHEASEITIPKPDKRGKENIEEIEELSSK